MSEQRQDEIYQSAYANRGNERVYPFSTLGAYADPFATWATNVLPAISFLASDLPLDQWRAQAQATLIRILCRTPARPQVKVESLGSSEYHEVKIEKLRYQLPYGPPTKALFLTPSKFTGKLPACLALHDHGGFKYFGKEKITEQADDVSRPLLQAFRDTSYGGHAWASYLARRGYAVLVHDVFPWGSRRILIEDLHPDLQKSFANLETGSAEYISAYNAWAAPVETEIYKSLCAADATFTGIVAYEDQCALDVLLSRPEVDPARVSCGGLSGGGLRSVFLSGLDPRLAASFVVGFCPTIQGNSYGHMFNTHTMLAWVPGMAATLDFPDVLSIHCPRPTFVLQCEQDQLFTLSSMKAVEKLLSEIFKKAGKAENFKCSFYPNPHSFTPPMQEDAFKFLDKHLDVNGSR